MIAELIEQHGLEPHPEGGFYRRVFEHPVPLDGRPMASSIVYLLPAGVESRWHRIDAVELWHAGSGSSLELSMSNDGESVERHLVGFDHGESVTVAVGAGSWQSARSLGEWSLVTVTVIPAFRWEGLELGPDGWRPGSS